MSSCHGFLLPAMQQWPVYGKSSSLNEMDLDNASTAASTRSSSQTTRPQSLLSNLLRRDSGIGSATPRGDGDSHVDAGVLHNASSEGSSLTSVGHSVVSECFRCPSTRNSRSSELSCVMVVSEPIPIPETTYLVNPLHVEQRARLQQLRVWHRIQLEDSRGTERQC